MCTLHVCNLKEISHRYFPIRRISPEQLNTAKFISKCRNSKANRQTSILFTEDLDQDLHCCVKMVKQISYTQEMKNLMKQQQFLSSSSLKTLQYSQITKFFSDWEEGYSNPRFFIKNCIRSFCLQILTSHKWLCQQST